MARVLDLTGLAGVYATRLLAEEGHDVIRVESPAGDAVRRLGPYLGESPDLESGSYHQFFNAGKRSLTLDLGTENITDTASEDAWAVFERLVATADVVVASAPLLNGKDEIRFLNPNLVLTLISNDEPPELCMYARAGLLAITGHPGATPVLMGGHIIYAATGLWVMVGTAAAMLVQRMTGKGQTVNVDVQECFETFLDHAVENFTARGRPTERRGHRGAVTPISGAFPCADGYWMLSLSDSTERWRRLVEWMDDDDLKDEALLQYDARLAQRDMILDRIGAWAMAFKKQDVVTEAQRRHFPSAPVATPLDLAEDPQLIARGFLVELQNPELGPMRFPRGAIANLWDHDLAPKLGQHNGEILTELGYGPEEQRLLFEKERDVSREPSAEPTQIFFEDVEVGTQVPEREYGPHDLVTAVFWAGVQENPGLLHLDRDHARQHRRAPSIVASGALRQSLLTRTLMDWAGPRAFLHAMELRHTASTYEGDLQRYRATVVEMSEDSERPWLTLELDGRNQDGQQIIAGRCTVIVPGRSWPVDRPTWGAL